MVSQNDFEPYLWSQEYIPSLQKMCRLQNLSSQSKLTKNRLLVTIHSSWQNICHSRENGNPVFKLFQQSGSPHTRGWQYTCIIPVHDTIWYSFVKNCKFFHRVVRVHAHWHACHLERSVTESRDPFFTMHKEIPRLHPA